MVETFKEKILELRNSGLKYGAIKKIVSCSISTISHHCKKAGLDSPNIGRMPSTEDINLFKELYYKFKSTNKVAKKTGWSKFTVGKYLGYRIKKDMKISGGEAVVNWRRRTKEKLVIYAGGKCKHCGYSNALRHYNFSFKP